MPTDESEIVSDSLVTAELRGVSSHGISRLEIYVRRVRAGLIRVGHPLSLESSSGGTLVFNGGGGFGHVVGYRAMSACIERARSHGVAAATVRNSTHFGTTGTFAELAAREGFIGIATSNAAARMPPIGGRTAVIGTNPLAVAVPSRGPFPIVLDMATSTAALGKILAARDAGLAIPQGWALTVAGLPTVDPSEAADGLLLPMAGPKGFGLAVILEILAGVLSGAAIGQGVGSMYRTWDRGEDIGHFFLALSVESFMPLGSFLDRIEELVMQLRSADRLSPNQPIRLPGEIEFLHEDENRRTGVLLGVAQLRMLGQLATDLAASLPEGVAGLIDRVAKPA